MVKDFRTGWTLWDKSLEAHTVVDPVAVYLTGAAVHNFAKAFVGDKANDIVPSGTDRLFKTRVTMHSATSATITTCDDGSKFEMVDRKTGVVNPAYTTPPNQQYMFETYQMVRDHGYWAISAISPVMLPDPRAEPCQPLRATPIL